MLKERGFWYVFPIGSVYTRSGTPDIIACCGGRLVAIECKSGKNKPTALQEKELNAIAAAGGAAFVVDEENVEGLRLWLDCCTKTATSP